MPGFYNLKNIYLGLPTKSGHETYLDAMYYPNADDSSIFSRIIFKKNKRNEANFSRLEVAFSQLAKLCLSRDSNPAQHLVINESQRIAGLAVEHLCYAIERKEGLQNQFFSLPHPHVNCEYLPANINGNAENIPFYFLDKLPQGFFIDLLNAERNKVLTVDYASLADILTTSYTLEEDDLHKGNFGFYLVEKAGKPQAVFFKIDHDLMFVDSIMGFHVQRIFHLFSGVDAFAVSAEDLINFPNLKHSANGYWPTKKSYFYNPMDNKEYQYLEEVNAFASVGQNVAFQKAKWLNFYKHILLSPQLIQATLEENLDKRKDVDRAQIALICQSFITRQARLKATLLSIKEFRDFVGALTEEETRKIRDDIIYSAPKEVKDLVDQQLTESLRMHQQQCQSDHFFDAGDTPLHIAIKLGDYRYEETLLTSLNFINEKNDAGQTPLDVAVAMARRAPLPSSDLRKDLRLTMRHLLLNGAEETLEFQKFNRRVGVASYQFSTPYLNKALKAVDYKDFKSILRDIGEDYTLCLKTKKQLAVECVRHFIKANASNPGLNAMLLKLKNEVAGNATAAECAGLMFIRQLRTRLWIIRQLRGLYGWSTTQGEINSLVNAQLDLEPVKQKALNPSSFFGSGLANEPKSATNAADDKENKIKP